MGQALLTRRKASAIHGDTTPPAAFDAVVFIGRFQPFHNGHLNVLRQALSAGQYAIVLVGSSDRARTVKDPFSYEERRSMISACLSEAEREWVVFAPIHDFIYNENDWLSEVQKTVKRSLAQVGLADSQNVALIGHNKDESSYYLASFPQWKPLAARVKDPVSATELRDLLLSAHPDKHKGFLTWALPASVAQWLEDFRSQPAYTQLREERAFLDKYNKQWAVAPYAPTFVTVDAVVIHSGHILLVKRRGLPGKGLWALPGGFLDQKETILQACLRELKEETGLKLAPNVLRGSIGGQEVFDAPNRSLRGRTITHAFLIQIDAGDLPEVRKSSEAFEVRWMPLSEIDELRSQLFEDHYDIILHMKDKVKNKRMY